jgi:L-fuconolactonase
VIIDGHLHLFRKLSPEYPRAVHDLFPPEREALAEEYLGVMAANGVDRAVVVPLSPDDEYLVEILREHPRSFMGVGVHADRTPVAEGRQRRLVDAGIQGLRLSWLGEPGTRRAEDLALFPTLRWMAERSHKVWFYAAPEQLPLLDLVATALPDLPIVMNHLGFCPTSFRLLPNGLPHIDTELPAPTLPAVLELARHPNIHVMLSGQYGFSQQPYPFDDTISTVRALVDTFGPSRMFWASDHPWILREPGYDRLLELPSLQLPDISADDLALIMGGTAARLFGVDDRPA